MLLAEQMNKITPEDYLEGELTSEVKHELVDGEAYAMAGAAVNHERIAMNVGRELGNYLKSSPCEPFGSDMKVRVDDNFFYPDVIVDCDFDESQPYYTDSPLIVVEVLSKSTRRIDETLKRQQYLSIPSLQEYVLIEQDVVDVEVVRRSDGWQSKRYYLGDEIIFDSIGLTLPVEEIYLRVQNEDVADYLAKKEEEARLAAGAGQQAAEVGSAG